MSGQKSQKNQCKNTSIIEIDSLPAFDITKELERLADLHNVDRSCLMDEVVFEIDGIRVGVQVERECRNFGGFQYFWVCPCCKRKCRILRVFNYLIACQKCLPRNKFRYGSKQSDSTLKKGFDVCEPHRYYSYELQQIEQVSLPQSHVLGRHTISNLCQVY